MAAAYPKYCSTRHHDPSVKQFFTFEEVVLKGLAPDGGLFNPHFVPNVSKTYLDWNNLSFPQLAYQVMRLYIDPSEITDQDLKSIVDRSYSTFSHPDTVPTITLDGEKNLHLLELFHGPTFAFKDVALQFLGNLFEFFLVRKNQHLEAGHSRHHLTVIGATSGDTGSAAIYGLRGKKDVSIFIMFPDGKVSPVQEAQMTTVLDPNVHCLSVQGTFDDCQDYVKALFADPEMNKIHHLAAVNSINWARILAQITYYFYAYFQQLKRNPTLKEVKFVVPSGNFGDILAGFYAKRMGLPIAKLIIATNENDILHRFWQTGSYTKKPKPATASHEGIKEDGAQAHEDGVKETYSPAMDILVSSNFERLLWWLTLESEIKDKSSDPKETLVGRSGEQIHQWFQDLKQTGSFQVGAEVLDRARKDFGSYRVSNDETLATIRDCYKGEAISKKGYVLDPHSAIGVAASLREISATSSSSDLPTISLATAHPAKFAGAVELALKQEGDFTFDAILPPEFVGLSDQERRVLKVSATEGLPGIRKLITREVEKEKEAGQNGA
jgi:threonine synthase